MRGNGDIPVAQRLQEPIGVQRLSLVNYRTLLAPIETSMATSVGRWEKR